MLLEVIATIVNGGGSSNRPLPSVIREQLIMDEDKETIRTLHHTIQRKARQRLIIGRSRNSRVNDNENEDENENESEISGGSRDDVIIPVQVPDDATVVLQQDVKARLSVDGTALRADDDAPIASLRHTITTTTHNNNIDDSNNNNASVDVVVDCQLTILEAPPLPTLTTRLLLPRLLQLVPLWGPEEGGTLIRLHGEGLFSQSLPLLQTMAGEAAAADSTTSSSSNNNNNNNNSNDRGVPHVRFGSVSVPCERINDTTLCCLSPPHPPGIVKVSLVRCRHISHSNNNNNNNNINNNSNLTGNNNRIILEEDDDDEELQDETTFEYVRMGAAFDAIFATTNSYCPLRSRQKQDHTDNNGVLDNNNNDDDDDDDDNGFTG
ncbi:hypothetical protein FRACYDRAFT_270507 [Fragilariopsis cylindrus CCMP1102]|uniref:IPT/TIG domain-containing protein n=1 Tax=Fragilariopsis cylindrus CCMP1102 TaxID=635003 RepID=A0A1E7F2J9_9STRA|nr:hypothetical protein FRACYDRAFT_270507 [Fragilariopsis cylindrus CCMP1102]|eukprot:OEU12053.1 hypothetical protein FRACYDRAFT_270507 [Fragilariopsis cylindrus CCMP1102]